MGYNDSTGRYRRTFTDRILLPLNSFFQLAGPGTPLAAFNTGGTTVPGLYVDDTNEAVCIRWNNDAAPAAIMTSVLLPSDRQPGTAMYLKALLAKTGATVGDATTLTTTMFMNAVGALRDADSDAGGTTSAIVGNATSKTLQLVSQTIADTDIPAPSLAIPSTLALTVKPTATLLGTDDLSMYAIWLEYTRALLAE